MTAKHVARCDCCSLLVNTTMGETCPRCEYPITIDKEKLFLEQALLDLKRVANHGGAYITVTQLQSRYQQRLHTLVQLNQPVLAVQEDPPSIETASLPDPKIIPPAIIRTSARTRPLPILQEEAAISKVANPKFVPPIKSVAPAQPIFSTKTSIQPLLPQLTKSIPPQPARPKPPLPPIQTPPPVPQAPTDMFSFRSFLADQTINIVASLGAFLILIGSLSFVANTDNLLQAFLVMFIVHAIFGATGSITYRFPSFRIVSVIYTAIFALLIPLVGFSGYRLVMGNFITLSPPTLIAIAAAYAAIAYAALAIYQRFTPFAYLSIVALLLVDLSTASANHLAYWWWPCTLMLLAFPTLSALPRGKHHTTIFSRDLSILRTPVHLLMYTCLLVCSLGILATFLYTTQLNINEHYTYEARLALTSMLFLMVAWLTLFIWRTQQREWANVLPYLFLSAILSTCYTFTSHIASYVIAITATALLFHGITQLAFPWLGGYKQLLQHLNVFAIVLVALIPVLASPFLLYQLIQQAYFPASLNFQLAYENSVAICVILVGFALSLSIIISQTGLRSLPDKAQIRWPWLLLLSGFLLNCAYSLVMLAFKGIPVWWFLGFTLFFVAGTILVRRHVSPIWAAPLDLLTLFWVSETLILSLDLGQNKIIALLLGFALLAYGVVFYQKRQNWLFLTCIFTSLALLPLLYHPNLLLVASLLLPLLAVIVRRLTLAQWQQARAANQAGKLQEKVWAVLAWEWPLILTALIYGISLTVHDLTNVSSTIAIWSGYAFPVALELALIACIWYLAAALARVQWWLLAVVGFGGVALLLPNTSFWILACVAPALAIGAFIVNRSTGRTWTLPLYITSFLAAIMTGSAAYAQGHIPAATWTLLAFALVLYVIGILENETLWIAGMLAFVFWSVLNMTQYVDVFLLIPCLLFPLLAVAVRRFSTTRWQQARFMHKTITFHNKIGNVVAWEWPLTLTALLYGISLTFQDLLNATSTIAGWSGHAFPIALELALIALIWYLAAALARVQWWLLAVVGFGSVAVFVPHNNFWVLACVAPFLSVGSWIISQRTSRTWAIPLYITSFLSAIMMGITAYTQGHLSVAIWTLLLFALVLYVIGILENETMWIIGMLFFVLWSVFDTIQYMDVFLLIPCLLFPLLAIAIRRFTITRWQQAFLAHIPIAPQAKADKGLAWEWPLAVAALLYGISLTSHDLIHASSTIASWSGQAFPIGLELAFIALVWYLTTALTRVRWWLLAVIGFGSVAVLIPNNNFWVLACVAPFLAIGSWIVNRLTHNRTWAVPLYITALLAATMMGITAYTQGQIPAAIWTLLFFALVLYVIGILENETLWIAGMLFFVLYSVSNTALYTDVFLLIPTLLFPLLMILIRRFTITRWKQARIAGHPVATHEHTGDTLCWEWPLALTALLYGISLTSHDFMNSILNGSGYALPVALEIVSIALVWYIAAYVARVQQWLLAVIGFGAVALLVPHNHFWILAWVAPALAIGAFTVSRITQKTWASPLYVTSLIAAVMMGIKAYTQGQVPSATWTLLIFALVMYLIGILENKKFWIVGIPFFVLWSVFDSTQLSDYSRPVWMVLICVAIGVGIRCLKFVRPALTDAANLQKLRLFASPYYVIALGAALLTGLPITPAWNMNTPFFAALPIELFCYALLAYAVSFFERAPRGQWLVAGFTIWATLLVPETTSCRSFSTFGPFAISACIIQAQNILFLLAGIVIITALLGMFTSRLSKTGAEQIISWDALCRKFTWNGAWYLPSLLAIFVFLNWSAGAHGLVPSFTLAALTIIIVLTLLIMLVERSPEMLILPVALTVWGITQTTWLVPQISWAHWQQAILYSVLCILIFATQFVWRVLPASTNFLSPVRLNTLLSLGIQFVLILTIIAQGGLSPASGTLAHIGTIALLVLSGLLFWAGRVQHNVIWQRWYMYISALLFALSISWETAALGYTRLDLLLLAPATYLVVIAPFLSRDEHIPYHHQLGLFCSLIGAILLLLPTLWLSFGTNNLQPTLFLASESLALLLLGIITRIRIFVLSGAALVVISAMHALFLPSIGIPSSLALAILGVTLLALATILSLVRHRLQAAWTRWE